MQLLCHWQLRPIFRLIESYSGTRACAADADDPSPTSNAASAHLICLMDDIGRLELQLLWVSPGASR